MNEWEDGIGLPWQGDLRQRTRDGCWPVVDADGDMVDICESDMELYEAAFRGWVYDAANAVYRVDYVAAEIVLLFAELLPISTMIGRSDADVAALALAWSRLGYGVSMVQAWFAVGVWEARDAWTLGCAGYTPAEVVEVRGVDIVTAIDVAWLVAQKAAARHALEGDE